MQIPTNTTTYNLPQVQQATSGQVQPDPDHDGQTSPGDGSAGGAAAPQTPASPGGQFDAATLGGLIALQQQQPDGSAATTGAHPHHHGHHGHGGRRAHGAGQGEAGAPPATSASASTDATQTQGA